MSNTVKAVPSAVEHRVELVRSLARRVASFDKSAKALIDLFVPRHHGFWWEYWPGFSAVYGLVSCVLIIVVSKFLGHQGGLMKGEDFYDD